MAGILLSLLVALGMLAMVWVAFAPRPIEVEDRRAPGRLTAAERRRLYQRLGIDPAHLARQRGTNVIWLDPEQALQRRSTDAI